MKFMGFLSKFLSRRLLVLFGIGVAVPLSFHSAGVSENVTLAVIALGATYMGQRAIKG